MDMGMVRAIEIFPAGRLEADSCLGELTGRERLGGEMGLSWVREALAVCTPPAP